MIVRLRISNRILTTLSLIAIFMGVAITIPAKASAYNGGRLIDNDIFRASSSMSKSQIQSFLVSKNSGLKSKKYKLMCYGAESRERALYTAAGATCDVNIPASEIIYYGAKVYGISPKVILATLQKEQSLITTTNPTSWQLSQAMGYSCPTSGSCSSESNFSYQIDSGTWVLRFHYERARGNNSYWREDTSWVCGTEKNFYKPNLYPNQNVRFYDENGVHYRTHFLTNAATSSMYCYTPHAFNNPQGLYGHPTYGTKGMYYSGSYNFVKTFVAWFGPTTKTYTGLTDPRWMETNKQTYKKNPHTGTNVDAALPTGTELRFVDKIHMDGQWYLRTEYDSSKGYQKGVLLSDLREFIPDYQSLDTPRWMEVVNQTHKVSPSTGASLGQQLYQGIHIYFDTKVEIGGKLYLRSRYDTSAGLNQVLSFEQLRNINPTYLPLERPRELKTTSSTSFKNPITEQTLSGIAKDTVLTFNSKTLVGGTWYLRTDTDTSSNQINGVPLSDLGEAPITFINFETPRWMEVKKDTFKIHPFSGQIFHSITDGQHIYFESKVLAFGRWYARTRYDTGQSLDKAVPLTYLENISYVPLDNPRYMTLKEDTTKYVPDVGESIDSTLPAGTKLYFTTKIRVNGTWYLRTHSDYLNNRNKAIPIQSISL